MPIEQRVVSGVRPAAQAPRGVEQSRTAEPVTATGGAPGKKNKLTIFLALVIAVMLAFGAVFWLFIRPQLLGPQTEPEPVPGAVHTVESINLNLSDGHYLRLGFAVQLTDKAPEVDGAKVIDTAISLYSGKGYEDVLDPNAREALKQQLAGQLDELYEGEVMEVYLTDYVAQ